jgi:hypothetical protein
MTGGTEILVMAEIGEDRIPKKPFRISELVDKVTSVFVDRPGPTGAAVNG